ncbi:MAG TPA: hypothetical protein VFA87_12225, partial [Rhizomicrobium sp.]|nr:hypothetical protein [Rhizomicrobium sp.]
NLGLDRQGSHRLFPFPAEAFENGAPRRIGEGSKKNIMRVRHQMNNPLVMDISITHGLWISQAVCEGPGLCRADGGHIVLPQTGRIAC